MHSYSVADVGSSEIKSTDWELLQKHATALDAQQRLSLGPIPIVYRYDHGYFVYCWREPADDAIALGNTLADLQTVGYSVQFRNLFEAAAEAGHKFLNFDTDGPPAARTRFTVEQRQAAYAPLRNTLEFICRAWDALRQAENILHVEIATTELFELASVVADAETAQNVKESTLDEWLAEWETNH